MGIHPYGRARGRAGDHKGRPYGFISHHFIEGESTMLDIKFIRENPDAVKENIKKSFKNRSSPW